VCVCTHTHKTHIYIYLFISLFIYLCVCVCVCVYCIWAVRCIDYFVVLCNIRIFFSNQVVPACSHAENYVNLLFIK